MAKLNNNNGIKIYNVEAKDCILALNKELPRYNKSILPNSLLLNKLMEISNNKIKSEDILNIKFNYGIKSEELEEVLKVFPNLSDYIDKKENKIKPESIREYIYQNGITLTFKGKEINYRMWFRSSSKSRNAQVLFINEKYYTKIFKWQTMNMIPKENEPCKLVELHAYLSLTSSSIENTININPNEILTIDDYISTFTKRVNNIKLNAQGLTEAIAEELEIESNIFDGQALLSKEVFEANGYGDSSFMLLRNLFFKSCAFNTNITKFMQDYCLKNNLDYETATTVDCYGNEIKLKDVKMITTPSSHKWEKFFKKNESEGFKYWKSKVEEDGNTWGVVKHDHSSKFGEVERTSYQHLNSLMLNRLESEYLINKSNEYIESLRDNNNFLEYLKISSNYINPNEMLLDIYNVNPKIVDTDLFERYKRKTLSSLKSSSKKGKLFLNGANQTIIGNPWLMLNMAVDKSLYSKEDLRDESFNSISNEYYTVATSRFHNGEYLCSMRSPHNSFSNIGYLKNDYKEDIFNTYFNFNSNIISVNLIGSDFQSRHNGSDQDLI